MNAREERGLVIAAVCKLNRTPEGWLVPSQSGERICTVDAEKQTCTCPDHQEAGFKCKHIYAVEFTAKREVASDGTVTDTRSVTFTEKKVYRQNWPPYNEAQSHEKERFQVLLHDLCAGVPEPDHSHTRGRRPHAVKDALFAMTFKIYSTFGSRRFSTDLREAHGRGYLSCPIPGAKITAFHENQEFTPILKQLIARSALPLRSVETKFAIDSSGFSSSRFERWFDHKYGITRQKCVWVKVHAACGVKTNVVTAVRILDKDAADSPQFIPLVNDTAKNFVIGEVSADKAYLSLSRFRFS